MIKQIGKQPPLKLKSDLCKLIYSNENKFKTRSSNYVKATPLSCSLPSLLGWALSGLGWALLGHSPSLLSAVAPGGPKKVNQIDNL